MWRIEAATAEVLEGTEVEVDDEVSSKGGGMCFGYYGSHEVEAWSKTMEQMKRTLREDVQAKSKSGLLIPEILEATPQQSVFS